MLSGGAARRININTDGRSLPTKKRWPTSSKLCAPRLPSPPLCLFCPPLPPSSDLVQGVAMSASAVMPFRSFVRAPIFSVSPSSVSLSLIVINIHIRHSMKSHASYTLVYASHSPLSSVPLHRTLIQTKVLSWHALLDCASSLCALASRCQGLLHPKVY